MTTLTKILLGISITAFTIGMTTDLVWGFGLPIGAIFFGLFMISKVTEGEMAKFDAEEKERLNNAEKTIAAQGRLHETHGSRLLRAA